MSTKCSICYIKNDEIDIHVYEECLDDQFVYIDLYFPGNNPLNDLTIKIPVAVWEVIRNKIPSNVENFNSNVSLTDEQIEARVHDDVNKRIKDYKDGIKIAALCGALAYGSIELSVDEQIDNGIAYFKDERMKALEFQKEVAVLMSAEKDVILTK